MISENRIPDDDDDAFEAGLKALRPRAPSHGFVDHTVVEARLNELTPGDLPEDFADRVITVGRLREVTPASPTEAFADRIVTEGTLREPSLVNPSPGFADRVVAACVSEKPVRRNILEFPRALITLAAAAALALAFAPALLREKTGAAADIVAEAVPVATPTVVAEAAPEFPEEALHLPVINLPGGGAYRPVLRRQESTPSGFRAMPGGAVMPVSFTSSAGVEYEPVVFE